MWKPFCGRVLQANVGVVTGEKDFSLLRLNYETFSLSACIALY